jgi:hypothetical protein
MDSKRPGLARWAAPAALFLLNALLTWRLFRIDYTSEMGSIEAAFIGLARYIRDHFTELHWFPLWYGGIPFPDSYPPLLHVTVAAVAGLFHASPGLAYHIVTAAMYALAPVALYWTARRLGAGRASAFAAGLLYSLVSPSCWLVREVRGDAGGWFGPRRLITLVRWGEGPHMTSLVFLAIALGLLYVAIEKRRPVYYALAAVAVAAVVLSNWIGAFALALGAAALALSLPARTWPKLAAIGAGAYALAVPWAPPSTIATIRANAPLVGGRYVPNLTLELVFAALFLLLGLAMARASLTPRVRFAVLFLYATAFVTLAAFWFQARLIPQAERYHLEMDMAFWLAAALLVPRLPRPAVLLPALLLLSLPVFLQQHKTAREMERPIDIRSTAEYEISTWLGAHMPGRRVFAPGTVGFWMNAFSDTPLLTGGFDNGMRNTFLQDVIFQVYFGDKPQVMLDWLNAFGCDAVVGGGPQSREVYHPYNHPEKFAGLAELWRDGPEVIYAVPRRSASLAHAVHAADLPASRPPAYDTGALQPYLKALDDPAAPAADLRWLTPDSAAISADLRPDHLLSVQVTYDRGWQARVNGEPRRTWEDKLGQMVVEARCSGACTVDLSYDGGAEMLAATWVSRLALAGGLIWILLWRKRSGSTTTN